MSWRVGKTVTLNVYENDRPVCQCHNAEDAANLVAAMNGEVIVKDQYPISSVLGFMVTIVAVYLILGFAVAGLISAVTGGIK